MTRTMDRPRLSVDIVSDVMCPWCIIGWLRFRTVMTHFAGRLDFRVQWHPFELNPDMPPEGEDAASHVQRKYGIRSEEHTSELQSLMRISYAVFCLKKKKKPTTIQHYTVYEILRTHIILS